MKWKDLGKKIGGMGLKIVGGALGGGAGAQVGGMVAAALGLEDESPEAIEAALSADPEALVKLKQFEMTHQVELENLALKQLAAHIDNTKDARAREIEIVKATGKRDWNQIVLSWLITAGFISVLWFLLQKAPPTENADLLYIIIGALMRDFGQVVQYNFGSSMGSKNKTGLMARKG